MKFGVSILKFLLGGFPVKFGVSILVFLFGGFPVKFGVSILVFLFGGFSSEIWSFYFGVSIWRFSTDI